MTGDEVPKLEQRRPAVALDHTGHGQGNSHQRRLRIFGQREVALRSFEHEPGEALSQGIVHLFENQAGGLKGFG